VICSLSKAFPEKNGYDVIDLYAGKEKGMVTCVNSGKASS